MSALPARRLFSAALTSLLLVAGAPFLAGVALATHGVTGSDPDGALNDSLRVVDIYGSGFLPGDQVSLVRDAAPTDTISGTRDNSVVSQTQIRASFELRLANPGVYDIQVSRTGDIEVCDKCFTIEQVGGPSVNTVGPTSGSTTNGALTIGGTGGFTRGSKVEFYLPNGTKDTGLTFTAQAITTNNQIKGTYSYTEGVFTPGIHTVRVTNTDGKFGECTGCFYQPRVDNLAPSSLGQGASNRPVTVNGAGLQNSTIGFSGTGITVNGVQSPSADGTTIALNLSVSSSAATGARNVTAKHPSGGYYVKTGGFTVNPAPSLTSTDPDTLARGAVQKTVQVTGTGFANGASFGFDGSGVSIASATYVSPTRYDLVVNVAADAPLGGRTLTIVNADGGSDTLADAITVAAGPVVGRVSPVSRAQGFTGTITVFGENFHPTGVTLDLGPGIAVSVTNITSSPVGDDTITATITIDAGAAAGFRDVTVTNNDDGGRGTCAGCFGVNSFSVTPTNVSNTTVQATSFTLSRPAGFSATAPVSFFRTGTNPGGDAITGTVDASTPTQILVSANFSGAAPGAWSVKVGTTDYCVRCVNVQGGDPTLSSAAPAAGAQGADNLLVTITGTNLANDGTIEFLTATGFSDPSISVVPGSYAVSSSTTVQVRINVADNATLGPRSIRYTDSTTPVAKTATCSLCFEVTAPPTVNTNGAAPNARGQGAVSSIVVISGTGFQDGLTVDFGPGITTGTPVVTDGGPGEDDTAQVPVSVADDATIGSRTVTVRNPDGGTASCTCFSVTAKPVLSTIAPAAARPGSAVNVTLTGSGFVNGAGLAVDAGPGITVSNLVFVDASHLTATFTVASSGVDLGPRDVVVVNPDGGRGRGTNVFLVANLPGQVTGLTATPGDRQVRLTWNAPSNGGSPITSYTVTCTPSCGAVSVSGSSTSATVTGLTNGTPYTFRVRANNATGPGALSAASNAVVPFGPDGEFVPVSPYRVYDTRHLDPPSRIGANVTRLVKITGNGPVPATGVAAVVLNVTVTNTTATGNVRVFPADTPVPGTTTVVYGPNETVANLTQVALGRSGSNTGAVKVYNSAGEANVILDVVGYFSDGREGSDEGDRLKEVGPKRIVDTRTGLGTTQAPLSGKQSRTLDIVADSIVPASATAVVVNTTVTGGTKPGFVTLYPANRGLPNVSNINFAAGQTVANLAVVKLGVGGSSTLGKIKAYAGMPVGSSVHLVLDIVGYYADSASGTVFKGVAPKRLVNTAASLGGTRVPANTARSFKIADLAPVPAYSTGVRSVVVSVQAASPSCSGHLKVWPYGTTEPTTSAVNFANKKTTQNLVVAKIASNGFITIRNIGCGSTDIVIDAVGYYVTQPA